MEIYKAIYKCRLCKVDFADWETTDRIFANSECCKKAYDPRLQLTLHNCEDGSIGAADFKGVRKVEELRAEEVIY